MTGKQSDRYLGLMGQGPQRIPQWEAFYCPEAMTQITGTDYYEAPRSCTERLNEMYPRLELALPEWDSPIPRPGDETVLDEEGHGHSRWGAEQTWRFDWGHEFTSVEAVLGYSPLAHLDLCGAHMPEARDYSDEEHLYQEYRSGYPAEWGDVAPAGDTSIAYFYNTLFIWPILTFGYQRFLEACLEPGFERVMDEFAAISGRVFRAFARLPVNFVNCHDDIVIASGPIVSPRWLERHVFPRYEAWWSMLREVGKEVIFTTDGCVDMFAENIFALGARGIRTEPYTDFKAIARRHPDACLVGEGDVRVLMRNDPVEIRAMVESMVETGRMCGGYFFSIGNLIPHNVPPEALKYYLDLCEKMGYR